jgi:hypothetical protein
MLLAMPSRPAHVAVCILRVEVKSWGPVITMTVNRDIATATAEPVTRFSDVGEAAAAVTAFLESFRTKEPLPVSSRGTLSP